ncbi:MAG TPA: VanZ family protein [Candidatus Methylomirabilis sp.]|nr:VanZ family protein [Candidatus Methylomirabilis sp.]
MRAGPEALSASLLRYGPALLWMGVIFFLSTELFSAGETGQFLLPFIAWLFPWAAPETLDLLHGALRKLGHLTEYAVLAILWYRAGAYRTAAWVPEAARLALLLAVAYAASDEVHQVLVASRSGSIADVAIDSAGAAAALLLLRGSAEARAALARG